MVEDEFTVRLDAAHGEVERAMGAPGVMLFFRSIRRTRGNALDCIAEVVASAGIPGAAWESAAQTMIAAARQWTQDENCPCEVCTARIERLTHAYNALTAGAPPPELHS